MPHPPFAVEITAAARADLYAVEEYWTQRGEAWRGEKYFDDLAETALRELRDPDAARRGRRLRNKHHPDAREILVFGVYRIIYEIDESAATVTVLRFWHSRRDEPPSSL